MSSVDERIVEMRFDNKDFENNVQQTMTTLDKLKSALNFKDASKSFDNLSKAANNLDMSNVSDTLDVIQNKFSVFGTIADQVIRRVADGFMDLAQKGVQVVKSLTVDQIGAGFEKYQGKLESVQSIMNSTGEDIETVSAALAKLNWFTDETSYNYTDMANTIGTFTAQGMGIDEAVSAVIGIADAAAFAGANAEKASHGMEAFAKAMSSGMNARYWYMINTAKMDNQALRQSFIDAAEALGYLKKVGDDMWSYDGGESWFNTKEGFTDNFTKWLAPEVMKKALSGWSEFSDSLYDAVQETGMNATEIMADRMDLVAGGYSEISEKAFKAGQQCRTFMDVISAVKDAISTSWMNIFEAIFGNYEEAVSLWTGLFDIVDNVFGTSIYDLQDLFQKWHELSGYDVFRDAIDNIFEAITQKVDIIREAFQEIFPPMTFGKLYHLTVEFKKFTKTLVLNSDQLEGLKTVLKAVFSIIKLGTTVLKIGLKIIGKVLGFIGKVSRAILGFIGNFSNFTLIFKGLLKRTGQLKRFFDALGKIFKNIGHALSQIGDGFREFGEAISELPISRKITGFFDKIREFFIGTGFIKNAVKFPNIFESVVQFLERIADKEFNLPEVDVKGIVKKVASAFSSVWETLSKGWEWIVGEHPVLAEFFENVYTTISGFFGDVKTEMDKFFGHVSDMFAWIGEEADKVWSWFSTKFPGISSFLKKASNRLGELFGILFDNKGDKFKRIGEWFGSINDAIGKFAEDKWKSVTDFLEKVFGGKVFENIGSFTTSISDFFKALFGKDDLSSGEESASMFDTLTGSITNFIEYLKTIDPKKIASAGIIILLGFLIATVSGVVAQINQLVTNVTWFVQKLTGAVTQWVKKNNTLAQLALVIISIMYGLYRLSKDVEPDKLREAAISLAILIGSIAGAAAVLAIIQGIFARFGNGVNFEKMGAGLAGFAAAVLILVVSLNLLDDATLDQNMGDKLVILGAIMFSLVAVAWLLSGMVFTPKMLIGAAAVLLLSLSLISIIDALIKLSSVPVDQVVANLDALVPLFAAFGVLAIGVGQIGLPSAVGLLAIVYLLENFLPKLNELSDESIKKIQNFIDDNIKLFEQFKILAGVLIVFAAIGGKNLRAGGMGIAAIAGSFLIIVFAIKKLGTMGATVLSKGMSVLKKLIVIIALLEFISGKTKGNNFTGFAVGVLILAGGIIALGLVAEYLGGLDANKVQRGLWYVSALTLLVSAMAVTSQYTGNAKIGPLLAMLVTVVVIAGVLTALAGYSWEELLPAAASIAGILLLVCGVFKWVSEVSKNALSGTMALLAIAVIMAEIAVILTKLSSLPAEQLLPAALALGGVLLAAAISFKLVESGKSALNLEEVLSFAGMIVAVAVVLGLLSAFNLERIIPTAVALSIVMLSLAVACTIMQGIQGDNALQVAGYVLGFVAALIPIGLMLALLGNSNPTSMLGAAAAMSLILGVIVGLAFLVDGCDWHTASDAVLLVIGFVGALIPIALILALLSESNPIGLIASAAALALLLGAVAAVAYVAQGITNFNAAMEGLKVIGIFLLAVAVIAGVMIAISELLKNTWPGWPDQAIQDLEDMGRVLSLAAEILGGVIGKFFGQMVSEFLSNSVESLPEVAEKLSTFVTTIAEAFTSADGITDTSIDKVKKVIDTLTKMEQFSNVDKQLDGIGKFSSMAAPFAQSIRAYTEHIKNIPKNSLEKANLAVNITNSMLDLVKTLQSGQVNLSENPDEDTLKAFGSSMSAFGGSLIVFTQSVSGIEDGAVDKATLAFNVASKVIEVAKLVPKKNGLLQDFTGEADLSDFSLSMEAFGNSLRLFCISIRYLNDDDVTKAENAKKVAEPIVDIANSLTNESTWSVITLFIGRKQTLDEFGTSMKSFGESLVDYCDTVKEIDTAKMDAVTESVLRIKELADALSTVGYDNLVTMSSAVNVISEMAIDEMLEFIAEYGSEVPTALENLINDSAEYVKSESDCANNMYNAGTYMVKRFLSAFTDTTSYVLILSAQSIFTNNVSNAFSKDSSSRLYQAGRNFMQGFVNGLRSYQNVVNYFTWDAARQIVNKFNETLGNASPSKITKQSGEYFGQGFINGLGSIEGKMKKKVSNVATGTVGLLNDAITKAVDYFDEGVDATPIIRPVLDLSSVSNGTYAMRSMFGGYSMNFATRTSGDIRASQESVASMNDLQTRLDTAIAKISEIIQNESDMAANTNYQFEIPFSIDGRELARASAVYNQEELNRLTRNLQRREGYR